MDTISTTGKCECSTSVGNVRATTARKRTSGWIEIPQKREEFTLVRKTYKIIRKNEDHNQ